MAEVAALPLERPPAGRPVVVPPLAVPARPHVRLGLAWAAVTAGAIAAGPAWLAAWLAVVGAVSAGQLTGAWRRAGERPNQLVAMAGAGGLPVAALWGPGVMTEALAGLAVLSLVTQLPRTRVAVRDAPLLAAALTLVGGAAIGLAAASPVLVRGLGLAQTIVLVALVSAYDVGAYLVGSGSAWSWEGPAAGIVCMFPVALGTAAALVSDLSGSTPWLLAGLAAVLAPAGPAAASALLRGADGRAPALGRLDVLLAVGPVWAWAATALR